MELDVSGLVGFPDPTFAWAPDADRLERETVNAELKGRRDELTLAEVQCSLDLLEAELAALRGRPRPDIDPAPKIAELTGIKGRLIAMARRLERLPAL